MAYLTELRPELEVLQLDYVLIQAFKKTASYIRQHNWFADTLALDLAAADFPTFLTELRARINDPAYRPEPLRLVPAPKSDNWLIEDGRWRPRNGSLTRAKLRPLAHVQLFDQVISTGLMMCLADRVETLQRSTSADWQGTTEPPVSYGNRLFCDEDGGTLRHRWGASAVYRAYFEDYRAFVARPEKIAERLDDAYIVHSDLAQFYDRVTPSQLSASVNALKQADSESSFFEFASRIFDWTWSSGDQRRVRAYADSAGIPDFSRVALPQGLVSAGFFANVVMLGFDHVVSEARGTTISPGLVLVDGCRYVDDLRFVVRSQSGRSDVRSAITAWLADSLNSTVPGALVSQEKTTCASVSGDEQPIVAQSKKMERIQSQISAGMDADKGQAILDAIVGLTAAQRAHSSESHGKTGWAMTPVADIRDATVQRFAAGRFRKTFRSIRPLLASSAQLNTDAEARSFLSGTTQEELDEQARTFALELIESWVRDPSSVRQLRIGLDIWPDVAIAKSVLELLDQPTSPAVRRGSQRSVGWYCLAELYRAVATETGMVPDPECLPDSVDIDGLRHQVARHAATTLARGAGSVPWYVLQQAALVTLVHGDAANVPTFSRKDLVSYHRVARVRTQHGSQLSPRARAAIHSVLYRCFGVAISEPRSLGDAARRELDSIDPALASWMAQASISGALTGDQAGVANVELSSDPAGVSDLASVVKEANRTGEEFDELSLINFAATFLKLPGLAQETSVPPERVLVRSQRRGSVNDLSVEALRGAARNSRADLYRRPSWSSERHGWQYQLGYLLRFMLGQSPDFTLPATSLAQSRIKYVPAARHWSIRKVGHYNGYSGLGSDWVGLSDWFEGLMFWLLRWPGMKVVPSEFDSVADATDLVQMLERRIEALKEGLHGSAQSLVLTRAVSRLGQQQSPLDASTVRICVVQSIIPDDTMIGRAFSSGDFTLEESVLRKRMRSHLATSLRTVQQALMLRQTHQPAGAGIDLVIFPELAAHPDDIKRIVLPFAQATRVSVLIGATYEPAPAGGAIRNAAFWILPTRTATGGVSFTTLRQGKRHLSRLEQEAVGAGAPIAPYRPVQWIVELQLGAAKRSLRMSAAVCYDATDLSLADVLRTRSDLFAVAALNRDVGSFDQMATALSYHMYQYVVVANNGKFGGSNAYAPLENRLDRRVFHAHGAGQATVSIFEIQDVENYLGRLAASPTQGLKHPPAGIVG